MITIDPTPPPQSQAPVDPHAAIVEVLSELEAAPHRPLRRWDLVRGAALILLPPALILGALWLALDSFAWSGSRDYSQIPAPEVFRKVTGFSVPTGVTDLRAAGRTGPFGLRQWVWITFRMEPKALRGLVKEAHAVAPSEEFKYLGLPATPMRT